MDNLYIIVKDTYDLSELSVNCGTEYTSVPNLFINLTPRIGKNNNDILNLNTDPAEFKINSEWSNFYNKYTKMRKNYNNNTAKIDVYIGGELKSIITNDEKVPSEMLDIILLWHCQPYFYDSTNIIFPLLLMSSLIIIN